MDSADGAYGRGLRLKQAASTLPWRRGCCLPLPPLRLMLIWRLGSNRATPETKSDSYIKSYVYLISPRLIVVLGPRLKQAASTFPWRCGCWPPLPPPRLIVVLAPQLELGDTRNEITHLYEITCLSDVTAADCRGVGSGGRRQGGVQGGVWERTLWRQWRWGGSGAEGRNGRWGRGEGATAQRVSTPDDERRRGRASS